MRKTIIDRTSEAEIPGFPPIEAVTVSSKDGILIMSRAGDVIPFMGWTKDEAVQLHEAIEEFIEEEESK